MDELAQKHSELHSPCSVRVIVDDLELTGTFAQDDGKFFCTVKDTAVDIPRDEDNRELSRSFHCTTQQFEGIVALLITGDESKAAHEHYENIGTLFDDFPINLRPIP